MACLNFESSNKGLPRAGEHLVTGDFGERVVTVSIPAGAPGAGRKPPGPPHAAYDPGPKVGQAFQPDVEVASGWKA
ncbi:MAG: hypothetical protein HYS12_28865 [Planctomycetes bacterium]|nr:hypothetical protein [Planctomycetota bacterium]